MTTTSQDLINSVTKNHTLSTCEADWRGICSRSYYTIYQDGKEFHNQLPTPGNLRPGSASGMHQELLERLSNPGIPKADRKCLLSKQIGALMTSLHLKRIKADYKRPMLITRQDADDSLAEANAVFTAIYGGTAAIHPVVSAPAPTLPQAGQPAVKAGNRVGPPNRPTLTRIK